MDHHASPTEASTVHHFRFEPTYRLPARLAGITPRSALVLVDDEQLTARFGRWSLATPIENIAGAGVTGPFSVLKTLGPPRLALSDRGLTFATNRDLGACIRFHDPVQGIDPLGIVRHPGVTVTVEDPEALVAALVERGVARTDGAQLRAVQAAVDDLHTMTASGLRSLAAERGISHPSSMGKAALVELLDRELDADLVDQLGAPT